MTFLTCDVKCNSSMPRNHFQGSHTSPSAKSQNRSPSLHPLSEKLSFTEGLGWVILSTKTSVGRFKGGSFGQNDKDLACRKLYEFSWQRDRFLIESVISVTKNSSENFRIKLFCTKCSHITTYYKCCIYLVLTLQKQVCYNDKTIFVI